MRHSESAIHRFRTSAFRRFFGTIRGMNVRCPTCRATLVWETAPYRPFCSERCKAIDLGRWLREDYRIPVQDEEPDPEEAAESSQA